MPAAADAGPAADAAGSHGGRDRRPGPGPGRRPPFGPRGPVSLSPPAEPRSARRSGAPHGAAQAPTAAAPPEGRSEASTEAATPPGIESDRPALDPNAATGPHAATPPGGCPSAEAPRGAATRGTSPSAPQISDISDISRLQHAVHRIETDVGATRK